MPVRGLELRGHHQESPGLCPHRMYAVPTPPPHSPGGPFPGWCILERKPPICGGASAATSGHMGARSEKPPRPRPGPAQATGFLRAPFTYLGVRELPASSPSGR